MNKRMRWEPVTWMLLLLTDVMALIVVLVLCIAPAPAPTLATAETPIPAVTPADMDAATADPGAVDPNAAEPTQAPADPPASTPVDTAVPPQDTPEPADPILQGRACLIFGAQAADAGEPDAAALEAAFATMAGKQPESVFLLGNMIAATTHIDTARMYYAQLTDSLSKYFAMDRVFPAMGANEALLPKREAVQVFNEAYDEMQPGSFSVDVPEYHLLSDYGRSVYYVDSAYARVFVLNTRFFGKDRMVSWSVRDWISKNIDPSARFTIFALYDAPFPVGAAVNNALDMHPEELEAFWAVVTSAPGPIVVAGGEATYARRIVEPGERGGTKRVTEILTGGLGSASMTLFTDAQGVVAGATPATHYVALYPSQSDIEGVTYNLDGLAIDQFAISAE